ncbi:potassium-transporting ATPase subunit KdpC [Consotaella aegiceratis]|uniref:potassium-transporting ATPase subunit KdpC n=1 Tax=Consotaella aegiceratis TaxID=3097961 RepID=UPI002F4294BA
MLTLFRPALSMLAVMTILTGFAYPLAVTGLAQLLFPEEANGSLFERDGVVIGSRLVAQDFRGNAYFHPRPSAVGYDGAGSGGSNLAPTSKALIERVRADAERLSDDAGGAAVPVDLVTSSGSGLDPDISPAAAQFQVERVARTRGLAASDVRSLVRNAVEGPLLGIFGEPRVNVLELNLALDDLTAGPPTETGHVR